VARRDEVRWLTVGFRLTAGTGTGPASRFQPGREAYALDLRQFTTWCRSHSLALFAVRRADIESFARELEAIGRARATVTRRLCAIAGFCKYAVEEEHHAS
jgi:site-specific recombinase XerD